MRTYVAVPSAYVALSVITGLPVACSVAICFMEPKPGSFLGLLTALGGFTLAMIWLRRFRIIIDDRTITYTSLTQRRTVLLEEIKSVKFSIEPFADPGGPTVRLTLKLRTRDPAVIINAKVFSREAIRDVRSLAPVESSRGLLDPLLPRG